MCTKDKIKVFAIENNKAALNILRKIFSNNELYEFNGKKVCGNDSTKVEKSRNEDKKIIMDILGKESFDILILDLLLRDNMHTDPDIVEREGYKGIEMVLSLEIARQLKEKPEKQGFLPVFISSSEICSSYSTFKDMRDKHKDKVPEDAVFIFKPDSEFDKPLFKDCPVYIPNNYPVCNKKQRDTGGCSQKTCFLELLAKYYEEYTKDGKK